MSIDSLATRSAASGAATMRPPIAGTTHMVSVGHYLASQAAFQVLQAGGNAVDAGVAAGIALGMLQIDLVDFAGVAPIMIYLAEKRQVVTIAGLGTWPPALARVFLASTAAKSRKACSAPSCRRRPTRGSPRSSATARCVSARSRPRRSASRATGSRCIR